MKTRMIFVLIALIVFLLVSPVRSATDKCDPFDAWIGGARFDYQIDAQGNWNLPDDVEIMATVTFPDAGLWKYYSASEDMSYVIVFLSLKATQPAGYRMGQHDICVYSLTGLGF